MLDRDYDRMRADKLMALRISRSDEGAHNTPVAAVEEVNNQRDENLAPNLLG